MSDTPIYDAAFAQRVKRIYWHEGLLLLLPEDPAQRRVLLDLLAEDFVPGRLYTKEEVVFKILDHHDDHPAILQALLDAGLLRAEGDGFLRPKF